MKRRIHIAVPCYSGNVSAETASTLIRANNEAYAQGWECTIQFRALDSLLVRARNNMVAAFLDSGADDLLFWDSDIAAAPGAVERIMKHPVDFVGGAYRTRRDPAQYIFQRKTPDLVEDETTSLIEVNGLGCGFLRITRKALEQTIAAHPDLWVEDSGRPIPWLFDFLTRDHNYYGEDFVFCERVREAGIKLWLDPLLPFHHIGVKAFFGRFEYHRAREVAAKTTPEQLAEAKAKLAARFSEIEAEAFAIAAE